MKGGRRRNTARTIATTHRRLHIPIAKLSLNVANFALFNLPFTLYLSVYVVLGMSDGEAFMLCMDLRNFYAWEVLTVVTDLSAVVRVINDVLIGFCIDAKVSGG